MNICTHHRCEKRVRNQTIRCVIHKVALEKVGLSCNHHPASCPCSTFQFRTLPWTQKGELSLQSTPPPPPDHCLAGTGEVRAAVPRHVEARVEPNAAFLQGDRPEEKTHRPVASNLLTPPGRGRRPKVTGFLALTPQIVEERE